MKSPTDPAPNSSIKIKVVTTALGVMTVLIAVDLISKNLAESMLLRRVPFEVLGDWLRFTLTYNRGIAFGFLATDGSLIIVLSIVATIMLAVWAVFSIRAEGISRTALVTYGILFAGAFANLLDRVVDGKVTDFIDIGIGTYRFATFNMADVFIVIGVGLVVFRLNRRAGSNSVVVQDDETLNRPRGGPDAVDPVSVVLIGPTLFPNADDGEEETIAQ